MTHVAYIGVGANLGDSLGQCKDALKLVLSSPKVSLIAQSSFYATEPVGMTTQDWFINAVAGVKTDFNVRELFSLLKGIEETMGRKRDVHWGPRVIDLDLLFFDEAVIEESDLKIPHPEIQSRRFVLEPMSEIAPDFVHPSIQKNILTLLRELAPDGPQVRRLS